MVLTHWGRVTHICVSTLTTIGCDNGLSPGRRQAIIWTNARILLIGPLGTNFSEILIEIYTFSSTKMHLKMSSGKWLPFCLGLNVFSNARNDPVRIYCIPDFSIFEKNSIYCLERQFKRWGFVLCFRTNTVKPLYNDYLIGYVSAFWSSSRWPRAT